MALLFFDLPYPEDLPSFNMNMSRHNMRSISRQTFAKFILILTVPIFLSGCGVTLSPVKRAQLKISPLETTLVPNTQTAIIRFDNTLPGIPLAETVWDNASGAFWNIEESNQIGFTQDYSKTLPAAAVGGMVGAVVVGTQSDYTRIVIPFGRIFEGVFQSGLQRVFPYSVTCFDEKCELVNLETTSPKYLVRLKVSEFQVWESPLNHINLKAKVECKVFRISKLDKPEFVYEARKQTTNQSLGSIMTTSSGFISEMNRVSNKFSAELSQDILENLQAKLGE